MTTKSEIFQKYNSIKKVFKGDAKQTERLNKGLGIALSGKKFAVKMVEYNFTTNTCNCPDATYRPQFVCKHQLAALMNETK